MVIAKASGSVDGTHRNPRSYARRSMLEKFFAGPVPAYLF
jgi:hypothetical protein